MSEIYTVQKFPKLRYIIIVMYRCFQTILYKNGYTQLLPSVTIFTKSLHFLFIVCLSDQKVVSACHGSVVSVWELDTGEKIIQFFKCHGNVEITAMAFDPSERRLVTGARDGSIKIWNFNNGACLSVLETIANTEVTLMKQPLIIMI